jgi:hypothetical protein
MTDHDVSPPEGSSDIESRLRHTLAATATREPVDPPDWGAFAGRLASTTRRRQRLLVGAVALALVVGGAGGYLGDAAASPGQVAARATGVGATPSTTAPTGHASAAAPVAGGPAVMCPNEPVAVPGATPATTTTTVGPGVNGSGDIGSATRLFIRTTSDGVTVRAYQSAPTAVSCLGGAIPQAGSASSGTSSSATTGSTVVPLVPTGANVTVELSDGDAVGQGAISSLQCVDSPDGGTSAGSGSSSAGGGASGSGPGLPPEPFNGPVATPATPATTTPITVSPPASPPDTTPVASPPPTTGPPTTGPPTTGPPTTVAPSTQPQAVVTGTFGVAEGDPVWWVAVEVPSDVTSVQMAFPDGSTDQMAPVGGVAVLAHRVTPAVAAAGTGPYTVRGTLQLLGTDGAVVGTVSIPQESTPVPSPAPEPTPLNQGAQSLAPGVILACPQATVNAPQAQSSGTTEKR